MTPAGAMGDTTRNYFRGPGAFSLDLGILKRTFVTEKQYVEFRVDFSSLLNHPNFRSPTLTMTSTTFGRIYSGVSSGSRKMQLGLKYYF